LQALLALLEYSSIPYKFDDTSNLETTSFDPKEHALEISDIKRNFVVLGDFAMAYQFLRDFLLFGQFTLRIKQEEKEEGETAQEQFERLLK